MGSRKLYMPGATLHIGKTDSGKYKLYVVGKTRVDGADHWIEAGGGAWRNAAPEAFEKQPLHGFNHPSEAIDFGRRIFSSHAAYLRFLSYPLGSESTSLLKKTPPPTFDHISVEPWL